MRIEVVRHGGFAGITKRQSIDISPAEAARIEELARNAAVSAAGPDSFTYTLTIEGKSYEISDPTVIAALRDILRIS